jgi:hypothetical protein
MAGSRSIGSLTVDLIARIAGFEQGMDKAARLADRRSKDISKSISNGLKGALGSVAAFTGGLIGGLLSAQAAFQGFTNAVNKADKLNEFSVRLGISTEQLSAWGYAAEQSGTDLESLTGALGKFSKTVAAAADSGSRQSELFAALGISIKDASGNLRDVEELLPEVADAFKSLDNDTTETALAMELFGRSGAELIEFLENGSDGLSKLGAEAESVAAIISDETAKAADDFNDELAKLRATVNGLFSQLAQELLPELTKLVKEFRESAKEGNAFGVSVKEVASAISGLVGWIKDGSEVGASFRRSMDGLTQTFTALYEMASKLANLDFSGFFNNAKRQADGIRQFFSNAFGDQADFSGVTATVQGNRAANARGGSNRPETGGSSPQLLASVNKFLAGSEKAGKAASKALSEADKEAARLKETYESLTASMEQQIALFGKTGEEAKLRYETESGSLANLAKGQKDQLLVLAQQIDTQERLAELQEAADERVKRESEAFAENTKANKEFIADMEFELELLGMTNAKRNEAIALRYLNADATEEEIQTVKDLAAAQEQAARTAQGWNDAQRALSDSLFDAISSTKSLQDAVKDFFEELSRQILQAITDQWAEQIVGAFSQSESSAGGAQGGGWMAAAANLFGSLFGGARANGGSVMAGVPYLVGERGPELFVAPKSGSIIPNHSLGMGGVNQTNNFIVRGNIDPRTQEQIAADVGRKSGTALRRNS